ncbi:MAG: hypothetical protein ABI832_18670 [bacterium]
MMRVILICVALAGCTSPPQVHWPAGPLGAEPTLLPKSELVGPADGTAEARGAALAAEAAALKARAAALSPAKP